VCASGTEATPIVQAKPTRTEIHEDFKIERERKLEAAYNRWKKTRKEVPHAWIHVAAHVYHKNWIDWLKGKMPDSSKMARRIEDVLNTQTPPTKPMVE
jgi:hypothetical protein